MPHCIHILNIPGDETWSFVPKRKEKAQTLRQNMREMTASQKEGGENREKTISRIFLFLLCEPNHVEQHCIRYPERCLCVGRVDGIWTQHLVTPTTDSRHGAPFRCD